MRLTLHQLYVFQMVVKHSSVSVAAQHLHMTQPAVSNILRQLNEYYQAPLFEIIGKKLYLTNFGKVVVEGSHQIQSTLDNISTSLEMLKGGLAGTLHVAIVSTAKYFVPQLLGKFKQAHHNVDLKLTVCNRKEILLRLQDNLDDFVIMSHPPILQSIVAHDFFADELILISSKDCFKKTKQKGSLKSLVDADWLIREEGSGTRYATEKILKRYKVNPRIEMELGDCEAIKQAVLANMGISIVPKKSVINELKSGLMKIIEVKELPFKHPWYLVNNTKKQLSPLATLFFEFVKQHR